VAQLMVTVDDKYHPAIKQAAAREQRPVAQYIRVMLLADLVEKGLVDKDTLEPVQEATV